MNVIQIQDLRNYLMDSVSDLNTWLALRKTCRNLYKSAPLENYVKKFLKTITVPFNPCLRSQLWPILDCIIACKSSAKHTLSSTTTITYQILPNQKFHGYFIEKNKNKIILAANFVHGTPEGKFLFTDKVKSIKSELKNNKSSLQSISGLVNNGYPVGLWTGDNFDIIFKNNKQFTVIKYYNLKHIKRVLYIKKYLNNKLHGTEKIYYPNGSLAIKTEWKNGKKFGIQVIYNNQEKMIKSFLYIEGRKMIK